MAADSTTIAPPAGFELDKPATPALPDGFVLDGQKSDSIATPASTALVPPLSSSNPDGEISQYNPTFRQRAADLLSKVRRSAPVETLLGRTSDEIASNPSSPDAPTTQDAGVMGLFDSKKPLVTPYKNPTTALDGLHNWAAGVVNSVASPGGFATAEIGSAPALVKKALGIAFGVQGAKLGYEGAKDIIQNHSKNTGAQNVMDVGNVLAGTLMAAGGAGSLKDEAAPKLQNPDIDINQPPTPPPNPAVPASPVVPTAARPINEAVNYSPQDLRRYQELQPKTVPKTPDEFSSPEFQSNWKEFEALRNKYNGMPPKQLTSQENAKAAPAAVELPTTTRSVGEQAKTDGGAEFPSSPEGSKNVAQPTTVGDKTPPAVAPQSEPTVESVTPLDANGTPIVPQKPISTPSPQNPSPTGLTEDKVNQEREQRGLEPVEKDDPISNEKTLEGGRQELASNPNRAREVIEKLRAATPEERSISRRDAAVLLAEKRRLINAQKLAGDAFSNNNSTPEQKAVAKQNWNENEQKINEMDKAAQDARSVWGGFGQFWQRMLKEDYSFDALRRKATVKLDRPLTESEVSELKKRADDFADAEAEREKHEEDYQSSVSQAAHDEAKNGLVNEISGENIPKTQPLLPPIEPHIRIIADRMKAYWDKRAEKALKEINSGKFYSTPIPQLIDLGVSKILSGASSKIRWLDEMRQTVSEKLHPFLEEVWDKAQKALDASFGNEVAPENREKVKRVAARKNPDGARDTAAEKKSIIEGAKEAVSDGVDSSEIGRYAKELAKNFVRQEAESGRNPAKIKGEEIDAAVHEGLKEALPAITPIESRDAWTGYGKFKQLNADPVDVRLREARSEQQKLSTLERLQREEAGLKTGQQRQPETDLSRRRTKQINQLKKELGIVTRDPATQLRSALDAKLARQKNRISDLKFENATRKRIVRNKSASPDNEETIRNKAEIDELERQNREIFGNRKLTDEQKLKMATAAAEKSAKDWEEKAAQARSGKLKDPKTNKPLTSDQIKAFKARSDAAKAEYNELQSLDANFIRDQHAKDIERQKESLVKSIAEQERKLRENDLTSKPKEVDRPADPTLEPLKQRRDALAKQVSDARKKPAIQKYADERQRQLDALNKRITEKESKISSGDLSSKPVKQNRPLSTPELEQARQKLDELNNQLAEARNPTKSPEEIALNSRLTRLKNQEADLADRIARKDFSKKQKPTPRIKSPEALAKVAEATARVEKLKRDADQWAERKKLSERSPVKKLVDSLWLVASRGASTLAVSFHGTVFMVTHAGALLYRPSIAKTYWTNFARQFKLWGSEKFYNETAYKLKTDPDYADAKRSGLDIDPEKSYTDYEYYLGSFGKHLGAILGARGALALKVVRLHLYKAEVDNLPPDIKSDPEQFTESKKQIADMVNKSTGTTHLFGKAENLNVSNAAHFVLFAPKLYATRWARIVLDPPRTLKTLADMAASKSANRISDASWKEPSLAEQHLAIRRTIHAAEFAATFLGALAINQGLLSASGSNQKVNFLHPSKSDWLKFKVHGKVVTADGGLLDPIRLIGQIVAKDLMDRTAKDRYERGNNFEAIAKDLSKYVRGKFSPSFGLIVDQGTGQDFQGRSVPRAFGLPRVPSQYKDQTPYSVSEYAATKAPIPAADAAKLIHDTMVAKGIKSPDAITLMTGAAAAALAATGISENPDYSVKKP